MGWCRSVIARGRRFCQLPPRERWLLAQTFLLLPCTAVALRLVGVRRWQRVLALLSPLPVEGSDDRRPIEVAVRLVQAAAHHGVGRPNCLERSLTLWWLLRRQGVGSDLRIGVRKEAGRFEAHAWVEYQGRALNDRDDVQRRFVPFDRVLCPRD